jgi:hypothetical protein
LDGNLFYILIDARRMRRPLIEARDYKAFIGQGGTSSRKVMKAYQGRRYCVYVGRKERGGGSVKKNV